MRSLQQYVANRGPSARGNPQPSTHGSVQNHATLCGSGPFRRSAGAGIARRYKACLFSQIVLENQGMVYNLAYRILGDPELAASATEDTFVRALRAFPGRRGNRPKLWMTRIVVTTCQEQLEALSVRDSDARSSSPGDNPVGSCAALFDHQLSIDCEQALLNTLPTDQRVAFVLSDVECLSYREIADVTGASVDVIRSLVSRGRTSLRNALLARSELSPGVQA
ncbi:MAG: sigma-70 family RNA polymerase sigma factor [Anaerolineae bacterium]